MRIGIDATALPPQPVGAGHYTIQLVRSLAQQQDEFDYTIFVQPAGRASLGINETARFHLCEIPAQHPAQRLLWEQAIFPEMLHRMEIDVLHSLHYTLPLRHPGSVVVTLHDLTFFLFPYLHTLPKRYFFRWFTKVSARRATALLAVSENTRQDAIRLVNANPAKIFTTPLGVTPEFHPVGDAVLFSQIRQKYDLPQRFILFVGLLEPRKNLPMLLRAFNHLKSEFAEHKLVIVGRKGWMYTQIYKLVESLALGDRVDFIGYVDRSDLPVVYSLADVFAYPSFYEGFGLPVLEAMACGVPVITTKVSSMPEIVGSAGCLVSPDDDNALADALRAVLGDQEYAQGLAQAGLQRAANFTWSHTAIRTIDIYRRIAQGML